MSKLEEVRAKIEAQRAAATELSDAQEAIDAEAVYEIGEELGVTAIREVRIPFIPGLPTLAVVRRPTKIEHKRFTDASAKKGADTPEYMKAAEQLAAVCVVYPPKELYEKMCEQCPGLKVPMGVAAANLAAGKIAEDSK